jgi:hypothetical protein
MPGVIDSVRLDRMPIPTPITWYPLSSMVWLMLGEQKEGYSTYHMPYAAGSHWRQAAVLSFIFLSFLFLSPIGS